ncbi:MAG: hypothetical protein O4859_13665 [Trichodesmium sp. St18_bin1]|nr:hypothetical protein [Trichodesmium sp. St18_bin1]MDE5121725.1 hypothetical protein [Trichodesmium sp. St19_bin1]
MSNSGREVKLRDKWWEKNSGALLDWLKLENLPVALLPKNNHNPKTTSYVKKILSSLL